MAKSGPKPVEIDWEQFDKLCGIQCTLNEISLWFACSPDTIERRVKEEKGLRFAEYWAQKAEKGRCSLRRKMWEMALKGDRTMLIWLSKQHLNFTEKVDHKSKIEVVEKMTTEQLLEKSKEAIKTIENHYGKK